MPLAAPLSPHSLPITHSEPPCEQRVHRKPAHTTSSAQCHRYHCCDPAPPPAPNLRPNNVFLTSPLTPFSIAYAIDGSVPPPTHNHVVIHRCAARHTQTNLHGEHRSCYIIFPGAQKRLPNPHSPPEHAPWVAGHASAAAADVSGAPLLSL